MPWKPSGKGGFFLHYAVKRDENLWISEIGEALRQKAG